MPLSAAPTRRIFARCGHRRSSDAWSTRVVQGTNHPSDAASSTGAVQAHKPTIGCRIVHQRCPQRTKPTMGCDIVHQCCPQRTKPTIGCRIRPPAPSKRTNQPMGCHIVHRRRPNKSKINSPRRHPDHSHRGGIGDSTLHSRNTLAFACRTRSANSVSLHARAACSSLSQLQSARSCMPALDSERSFS